MLLKPFSPILKTLGVIFGLGAIIALALGSSYPSAYALACVLAVPGLVVAWLAFKHSQQQARLVRLQASWGQAVSKDRDFEAYHSFLELKAKAEPGVLDPQSAHDLGLDDLFEQLDRTESLPGEFVLYHMLHSPLRDKEALDQRRRLIDHFLENPEQALTLRWSLLEKHGLSHAQGLLALLWHEAQTPSQALKAALLSVGAFLALFSPFVIGPLALFLILGLFLFNMKWHYQIRDRDRAFLSALVDLRNLLDVAKSVARAPDFGCAEQQQRLTESLARCQRIHWALRLLKPHLGPLTEASMSLFEYVSIYFLLEVQAFFALRDDLLALRPDLQQLFQTLGELDAMQSLASYRSTLERQCRPEFCEELSLEVTGLAHPLLDDAVANSLTLSKGLILTGSNMAGKSTFLRSLGLAALLSQTAVFSPSESYKGPLFQIRSSMSVQDELAEGKSFFHREAENLLAIYKDAQTEAPSLLFVDEILKGTNSAERLAAAIEILRELEGQRALLCVATHDTALAEALKQGYECWHFTDQQKDGQRSFDYQLKRGIVQTTNALATLEALGFPSALMERARASMHCSQRPQLQSSASGRQASC